MALLISVIEQGLIYALMALGVYITYKILDFPDLTVDGSFPFGAALTAMLIVNNVNPLLALLLSFIGGLLIGTLTGLIHVKLGVRDLLSGIIMMTALYSVNLRVAGISFSGKSSTRANVPFYQMTTIFDNSIVDKIFKGLFVSVKKIAVIMLVVIIVKILLDLYLKTKSGFMLRAVGDNPSLVTTLAVNKGTVKILGLAIANGLVSLSGSVFAQQQRFFDISMGTGTVAIGLASVIIGTSIFKRASLAVITGSVIIGSVLYKGCVALSLAVGLSPSDVKLVTAILFLAILVIAGRRKAEEK